MNHNLLSTSSVKLIQFNECSSYLRMSAAAGAKSDDTMMFCASCGTAGDDDIKLKRCTACRLVRYCSVKCQKEHRSKHKKACKKRAAELHDEILFKQPESSHWGDCPICCLPIPIDPQKSTSYSCCSKYICIGCDYANKNREIGGRLQQKCPFCRIVMPDTDEEWVERSMKRIEMNHPVAICDMGTRRYYEGDFKAAFEFWTRAADLGNVEAHFQLSILYQNGYGVKIDAKKEQHHLTEAAIGGHPNARHNLGCEEETNRQYVRAVKHWIIAAKLGFDMSLQRLKELHEVGFVSKKDFAGALRGHKAAIDATKSLQREEAEKWIAERKREEALRK